MPRPTKGVEHVESLEGPEAAKARLVLVLETLSGAVSVDAACAELTISPARFAEIRKEALAAALKALAPRPAGRPPEPAPDAAMERMKAELFELKRELEASRIREEIALTMPHVLLPPTGGEKRGPGPKRGGRRGT